MKSTRRCPKCGSEDIVSTNSAYDVLKIGIFDMAEIDRWVCCACGYCELWADPAKLEKLREFWKGRT